MSDQLQRITDDKIVDLYKRAHVWRINEINEQIKENEHALETEPNAPEWAKASVRNAIPQLKMMIKEYTEEYNECLSNNDVKRMRRILNNPYYDEILHQLSNNKP